MIRTLVLTACIAFPAAAQTAAPRSDVPAPPGFRANRNSYSSILDVLRPSLREIAGDDVRRLKALQFETIWGALGEYQGNYVRGFVTTQPGQLLVGRAVTIRFLPPRPDLERSLNQLAAEGGWPAGYYQRAAEDARPGDVYVVDLGGDEGSVFMGDISALGMKLNGAAGVVIDGATRDQAELSQPGFRDFPAFVRHFHVSGARWLGAEWNLPIRIRTATVLPGDVVVAADEGVLFFPAAILGQVLHDAEEHEKDEVYIRSLVRTKKYRFRDVYPPTPEIRKKRENRQP